jgi:CheY-like chemotaxis protein
MYENDENRRMTVFFADDDLDDQHFFRKALSRIDESIELITANNGEEAINILFKNMKHPPDFIFLDVNMPRMSGVQCLHEIRKRENFNRTPVILYSTSFQNKDNQDSKLKGAQDFFRKPTSLSDLIIYLRSMLLEINNLSL